MYGYEHMLPDPPPKVFRPASGRLKVYVQEGVDTTRMKPDERAETLGRLALRAAEYYASRGWSVEWHTLAFEVRRSGMELLPDQELWAWSVWVS